MSKCWEVRLDGLPRSPGEQGCLLAILLIERREHPPRQLPLHLSLLLTLLPFFPSYLAVLRLLSEIMSLDMTVSIWRRGPAE